MKLFHFIYFVTFLNYLVSCSTSESIEDNTIVEDCEETIVSQDGFLPGDEVTRATLTYSAEGLTLNWSNTDQFGIFPTSVNKTKPEHSSQIPFEVYQVENNPQEASIKSINYFSFNAQYGYTAYFPYKTTISNYEAIPFDFTNQTQKGYVNMGAYYGASENKYENPTYKASETSACKHLLDVDILISPEMTEKENGRMYFRMRHIGAIARFFLLTPAKQLKIKELRLISNNEIFYKRGKVTLERHPYISEYVPQAKPIQVTADFDYTTDNNNYGVCLPQFSNPQVIADEDSKTNCLVLKFGESGNGIDNLYSTDTAYGNYLLAYMMMYPITTSDADNVYVYVTAEDTSGKEVYFRTGKLANKTMFSGYVYQWKERTTEDTPIELTATLLPWQEVASGAIETDLEK